MSTRLTEVAIALALCHNVTPVIDEESNEMSKDAELGGEISYQASSPDEIAIVRWTERAGLALTRRDLHRIQLRYQKFSASSPQHASSTTPLFLEFDVLAVFPFTSDSKRMGAVIRSRASQEVYFYLKGADSVMASIVQYNDWWVVGMLLFNYLQVGRGVQQHGS